jgi:putative flippase GtrA
VFRFHFSRFVARYRDLIAFSVAGILTGAVYFSCIAFLLEVVGVDYRIGVTTAYLLALVCHFLANRLVTFRERGGKLHLQLLKYALMVSANLLTTMGVVIGAVNLLNTSPYAGALAAIAANLFINYFLAKYWIFSAPQLK